MLRRVALVRTGVSKERITSITRVTIGERGTLAVTSNLSRFLRSLFRLLVTANVPSSPIAFTLMMEAINSSETSDLTRAARRYIQEDGILRPNLLQF
jgi:hypothetical protein